MFQLQFYNQKETDNKKSSKHHDDMSQNISSSSTSSTDIFSRSEEDYDDGVTNNIHHENKTTFDPYNNPITRISSSSSKTLRDIIYASSSCSTQNISNLSSSNNPSFFFDSTSTFVKTADNILKVLAGVDDIRVNRSNSFHVEEDNDDNNENGNQGNNRRKGGYHSKSTTGQGENYGMHSVSVGEKRLNSLLRDMNRIKAQQPSKVLNPKPIVMVDKVPSAITTNCGDMYNNGNNMDRSSGRTIMKGLKKSMAGKEKNYNGIALQNRVKSYENGKAIRMLRKKKKDQHSPIYGY